MFSHRKFPVVFAGSENGFIPAEFCFVAPRGTKHCRLAKGRRIESETGSWADPKKDRPGTRAFSGEGDRLA
jgi:hypothetical protein